MAQQPSNPQNAQEQAGSQDLELYRLNRVKELLADLDINALSQRMESTLMTARPSEGNPCPNLTECGVYR